MAPSASSALRTTYKIRKNCIKKKIEELAILCDVEAMAIILGPDGSDVTTWPENRSELKSVITKCRNHSGRNQAKKNLEKKKKKWVLSDWDYSWLDGLSGDSLLDFSNSVRAKIDQAKKKSELLVNVAGTEQFPQTSPSSCVDDMRSYSFQTVPNCVSSNGGEHIKSVAQVNSFGYGCGTVTGQQYLNSSSSYGYGIYDHGECNNVEAEVDGNYVNSPMFFDLYQAAMTFSYDSGSVGSLWNGNVNNFCYLGDSVTGQQLFSAFGHGSGMYDHPSPELGFVEGVEVQVQCGCNLC